MQMIKNLQNKNFIIENLNKEIILLKKELEKIKSSIFLVFKIKLQF